MMKGKIDLTPVLAYLNSLSKERGKLRYAVSKALNKTAKLAQDAIRANLRSKFVLRRKDWILKGVYINKFSDSSRLEVTISIEPKRALLEKFEDGGEKVATGVKNLAVPDRKTFNMNKVFSASDPLRPKNLNFQTDGESIRGAKNTFIAPMSYAGNVTGLILQNVRKNAKGANKNRNRVLFRLVKRVKIPARLSFVVIGGGIFNKHFDSEIKTILIDTLQWGKS